MRRFLIHLRLYVHHLRRGIVPKRWPPRLIEPGKGKRPCPRYPRTAHGEGKCYCEGGKP